MIVQGHFLDIAAAPAVVVDDRHPVAGLQQLLGLHAAGAVGIHHHQQGAGLHLQKRLAAGEEGPVILRLLHQLAQDGVGGVVLGVDDDLALLPPLAGDAAHACRRAQGVHVRIAVAHDVHLPGVVHQLAQGVGHDPGLHLGALLGALGPAAVKLEVQPVLHHRLVAAPAQSHLQGQGRVFEQGVEAVGVPAHADGQGSRHAAGRHLPHGIQHGEAVLGIVGIAALLEHEQIPVPVIVQHQAVGPGGPLIQLLLQLGQHRRALALRAGLHQVLIVIHHQDGHHRPGHL